LKEKINYYNRFQPNNIYTKNISYEDIMNAINKIIDILTQ